MTKLRDTASRHIDAPTDTVVSLLRDPSTLSLTGLEGTRWEPVGDDEVEVRGNLEGVHLDERCRVEGDDNRVDVTPVGRNGRHAAWFVAEEEGDGTRLVHGMWVEPANLLEAVKARSRAGELHELLEASLDRVQRLAEAVRGPDH